MTHTPAATTTALADTYRAVLEFAKLQWGSVGARETALRDVLDMTPARYAQVLAHVIRLPAAVELEPALCYRLRRLEEKRAEARRRADRLRAS